MSLGKNILQVQKYAIQLPPPPHQPILLEQISNILYANLLGLP